MEGQDNELLNSSMEKYESESDININIENETEENPFILKEKDDQGDFANKKEDHLSKLKPKKITSFLNKSDTEARRELEDGVPDESPEMIMEKVKLAHGDAVEYSQEELNFHMQELMRLRGDHIIEPNYKANRIRLNMPKTIGEDRTAGLTSVTGSKKHKDERIRADKRRYTTGGYLVRQLHSDMYKGRKELFDTKFKYAYKRGSEDSEEMAAFKESVGNLNTAWTLPLKSPYPLKEFEDTNKSILDRFDTAIKNAANYMNVRNPRTSSGKKRYQNVKFMYDTLIKERDLYVQAVNQFKSSEQYDPEDKCFYPTEKYNSWSDILFNVRTINVGDIQGVGLGGTGSANKFEKDGKTWFFKNTEQLNIRKNVVTYKELNTYVENNKDDSVVADVAKYIKTVTGIINRIENGYEMDMFPEQMEQVIDLLRKVFTNNQPKARLQSANAIIKKSFKIQNTKTNSRGANIDKYIMDISDIADDEKAIQRIQRFIDKHGHRLFTASIARGNMLNTESNLSNRSVATYRIANYLKMNDVIPKTESCVVISDSKLVNGVRMEQAAGITFGQLIKRRDEEGSKIYWSQQASIQMLRLQLFDMLCGQCDRHQSNFICELDEEKSVMGKLVIKSIKGIDNDMSFGRIDGGIISRGFNRINSLFIEGELNLKFIDEETYNMFVNSDVNSMLNQIADLGISDVEKQAFEFRHKQIRRALISKATSDKNFVRKKGDRLPVNMKAYWRGTREESPLDAMGGQEIIYENQQNVVNENIVENDADNDNIISTNKAKNTNENKEDAEDPLDLALKEEALKIKNNRLVRKKKKNNNNQDQSNNSSISSSYSEDGDDEGEY